VDAISIIASIVPILSGLAGYFFGKRKNNAEAESVELLNVGKAVNIYKDAAAERDEWISRQRLVIADHEKHIKEQRKQINEYRELMSEQNKTILQIAPLRKRMLNLELVLEALKAENHKLKQVIK
jgi:uncharacterized protein (DUF3084 family)